MDAPHFTNWTIYVYATNQKFGVTDSQTSIITGFMK